MELGSPMVEVPTSSAWCSPTPHELERTKGEALVRLVFLRTTWTRWLSLMSLPKAGKLRVKSMTNVDGEKEQ